MPGLDPGTLDRLVTIQRPVASGSFTGAGEGTWEPVADVWASVQDVLPSNRAYQQMGDGLLSTRRPSRVRIYYREDVDSSMRFVLGERVMKIVSGPAEIGRRDGLEFMVEDWKPAGSSA